MILTLFCNNNPKKTARITIHDPFINKNELSEDPNLKQITNMYANWHPRYEIKIETFPIFKLINNQKSVFL